MKKVIVSRISLFFVLIALFNSCANYKQNQAERKKQKIAKYVEEVGTEGLPLDTIIVDKKDEPAPKPVYVPESMPYQASEEKITDLIHTKLNVSFDWTKQHMFGEAELTLSPYFFNQNTVILDAKGFDIHQIAVVQNGIKTDLTYTYPDSIQLVINLDKEYTKEEKYKLYIKYTSRPNDLDLSGASSAISDDKGLYFINPLGEDTTKPRQIWTQGETEASSCWFPTIDQPNEKTTEEISITTDTNFVTISNGKLKSQINNGDGTRTDYWVQNKPHSPYLFMMAIGEFSVINDKWIAPERKELLEVNYYVEKDFEKHALKIFGNTPEMLGFFSKKLGYEYPWDKYSQIIVRDYVSGAMENTSASLFMEQVQVTDRELLDKNWDYIIAHELFHHWFGDLVTCESWSNLSLNESFANYSEYLWYEYKYGRDYADAHRQEELGGYMRQAAKSQFPIVRYNYNHRMDMFDSHSYNKGGLVLHMLRKYLGDEAFFASLKHYLHKNEYTDAEIHELRLSFEEVTGKDLNWFFNQWFLSPGHPELAVTKTYENDTLTVTVIQNQDSLYTPFFEIPTDLELIYANGSKEKLDVLIKGHETVLKFPLSSEPVAVVLDSEQSILGVIEYKKDSEENITTFNKSDKYQSRYDALDALIIDFANTNFILRSDSIDTTAISIPDTEKLNDDVLDVFVRALDDESEHIRAQSLLALRGYDLKRELELNKKYIELAQKDKSSLVRASAVSNLSTIYKLDNPNPNAIETFKSGLEDSSYAVVGEALLACVTSKVEGSEKYIDEYKNSSKANILKSIGKYYYLQEDSTKSDWAVEVFEKISPGDKIDMIKTMSDLMKVSSLSGQEKLMNYFHDTGVSAEDIYSKYASYRVLHAADGIEGVRELRQDIISKEESSFLLGIYKGWETSLGL